MLQGDIRGAETAHWGGPCKRAGGDGTPVGISSSVEAAGGVTVSATWDLTGTGKAEECM